MKSYRLILIYVVAITLIGCGRPPSYNQCILDNMENLPDSAFKHAEKVCRNWFPEQRKTSLSEKDKNKFTYIQSGKYVSFTVPKLDNSFITFFTAEFSENSCNEPFKLLRTAFVSVDYGKYYENYELKNPIYYKSSPTPKLGCMNVKEIYVTDKPPTLTGKITAEILGEDFISF